MQPGAVGGSGQIPATVISRRVIPAGVERYPEGQAVTRLLSPRSLATVSESIVLP